VLAACSAACVIFTAGASSAATALSTTLYVSPAGSDTTSCTQTAPCQSFNRAYLVALPGQLVQVAAGTYAAQTIWADRTKTSLNDVVFQPAGPVVVGGTLNVYAKHIEFRDMTFAAGWLARGGSEDVTFRNTSTKTFSIGSARSINVIGGQVGPWMANGDGDPKIAKSSPTSTTSPMDIVIDGVRFHDILRPPGSGYHIECLQIGAAVNLAIRNSRFENCAVYGIFLSSWGSGYVLQGITIQNNVFGTVTDGYHSLGLNVAASGEPCVSCTISGNTAGKPIAVNVERSGSSILVTGNTMDQADLHSPGWCDHGLYGVSWSNNHFRRTPTCGTGAIVGP
jgi:hypothetical protein